MFEGAIPGATEPVPEAATLLGVGRELGIAVGAETRVRPSNAPAARRGGPR